MEIREYHRLREHEQSYWWHVGRRSLLGALIHWGVPEDRDRPGLDIGCGTGENFALLEPYGRFVGSEITGELYGEGRVRPSRPVLLARGESLPFADETLGICTFLDVLEHIEEEDRFLREIHRVLRPGGLAVISVPAYMFLWSDHDVSLHHCRRYVRRQLAERLGRNGFEALRVTYAMASTFPLVAGYRLLSRLLPGKKEAETTYVRSPRPLNAALIGLLGLEARWLAWGDLPFGSSLLALARKRIS